MYLYLRVNYSTVTAINQSINQINVQPEDSGILLFVVVQNKSHIGTSNTIDCGFVELNILFAFQIIPLKTAH